MTCLDDPETERLLAAWETYCRDAHERRMELDRMRDGTEPGIPVSAPWWIAHPNTNCAQRAYLGLRDRGFEVWQPATWREVRTSHQARRPNACRIVPVPGYLFTRHGDPRAWPEMVGVDGVRAIRMWASGGPQTVPAVQVAAWRAALAPSTMPVVEDAFRIGAEVRIVEGPFSGFLGTVERVLDRGGVEVAVGMFRRSMALKMGDRQVEVV